MRWVILAAGVVAGAGTAWLVHRPTAAIVASSGHGGSAREDDAARVADAVTQDARQAARARQADDDDPAVGGEDGVAGIDERFDGAGGAGGAAGGPPPEVVQALAKWVVDGRAVVAAKALRKAGEGGLADTIEAIDALRLAGQSALLRDALEEADARWGEAILRERSLPLEGPSNASGDLRGRLAAAWHERALLHEERGQAAVAFAIWQRATAIDPSHLDSLAGLQRVAGSTAQERGSNFQALPVVWPKPTDRP